MKSLLKRISEISIVKKECEYDLSSLQLVNHWLGFEPPFLEQIIKKEKELGVVFPQEYKDFLLVTNGLISPSCIDPSFLTIEKVMMYSDYEFTAVGDWDDFYDDTVDFENSILIGGVNEEQQMLLVPIKENGVKWEFWTFAYWSQGETIYKSLEEYFTSVKKHLEEV